MTELCCRAKRRSIFAGYRNTESAGPQSRCRSAKRSMLKQREKRGSSWRHDNIGRLLNNAVRRFEGRVLEMMGEAGYADTRIAHVNLTRNLDVEGTRLTE